MQDPDAKVSLLACMLCVMHAAPAETSYAVYRLISLLSVADGMVREEIEDCLVANYDQFDKFFPDHVRQKLARKARVKTK